MELFGRFYPNLKSHPKITRYECVVSGADPVSRLGGVWDALNQKN